MKEKDLRNLVDSFRLLATENECVEFKEAKNTYDFNKLGKYFSALANEANLKGRDESWLIFGIKDKPVPRVIIGSNFRTNKVDLESLKAEIANKTTNRITFNEIYELNYPEGRVILFHIPSAPKGFPVAWEGHYYGRDGEDIGPLNLVEIEKIRSQATKADWSAKIIPDATIGDLEEEAIKLARTKYKTKFPRLSEQVDGWDDITFLNKAKITIGGKITNTAIILLGEPESTHFINPAQAMISWILKNDKNMELDYEHFDPPFLINVEHVLKKIRNLKYRYIREKTLFPVETDMYDDYVIREALHNCIAHQDYSLGHRISVVEFPKKLIFSNGGHFTPDDVIKVLHLNAPEQDSQNKLLVNAMFNLDMIDTIGSGIKNMFQIQKERLFPLPEYTINDSHVSLYIYGEILKMNYARYLFSHKDLSFDEIIILDKYQKDKQLTDKEIEYLKTVDFLSDDIDDETVVVKLNDQEKAHDEAHDEAHDLSKTEINILKIALNKPQSTSEIIKDLGLTSRSGAIKKSLSKLLELEYLEFTIPEKPKSKNQKYKITQKGKLFIRTTGSEK